MADNLVRAQLARLARQLAEGSRSSLPPLVFLTDDARVPNPLGVLRNLPRETLVILRSRDVTRRRALAFATAALAREYRFAWIVAEDALLAAEAGADGVHFPERMIALAADWRARRPGWLITAAAHSLRAAMRAASLGANAVLLAPVFPTESHPGGRHLGSLRARMIANAARMPVYALGGIDARTARALAGARLAGLAAIGALALPR